MQAEFSCFTSIPDEVYDYICITSAIYYDEIKKELLLQSVDSSKILPTDFWIQFLWKVLFPNGYVEWKRD